MRTTRLSKYMSRWFNEKGFEVCVRHSNEFSYIYAKDIINYTFEDENTYQNKIFRQVLKDEGLKVNISNFVLSIFHELGHYMTIDEWENDEYEKMYHEKENLDGNNFEDNLKYFYMPDEIMATRWAVEYINENANEVCEFAKTVFKLKIEVEKGE